MERVQKVLAHAGIASRRKCEQLILDGRVRVNGIVITELGMKVDRHIDQIEVDGKQVTMEKKVYVLLHKPTGVITSLEDPQGRPVVIDYVKHVPERIYPVGRLDLDTSGALLLTNDGQLANRLMHPSSEVHKTYEAVVSGVPDSRIIQQLQTGVRLEDGWTAPARVRLLNVQRNSEAKVEMTIHEGRNRQVRRMFEAVGYRVRSLHRSRFAFLDVQNLRSGQARSLRQAEVSRLQQLTSS